VKVADDLDAALALAREHLAEFAGDIAVRRAVIDHVLGSGTPALVDELCELLADVPA